jgi:hypothetical protein
VVSGAAPARPWTTVARKLSKALFALSLVGLSQRVLASIDLTISEAGKKIGSARYEALLLPSHGRQTTLVMRFTVGARAGTVVSESEAVDSLGRQLEASFKVQRGSNLYLQATATFARNGDASVKVTAGGRTRSRTLPAPKTTSRRDLSEFWFLKRTPPVGTWVRYEHLTLATMKWEPVRTTFVGRKSVSMHGRSVLANKMTQSVADATEVFWLDDEGMPLVIETDKTRLERS